VTCPYDRTFGITACRAPNRARTDSDALGSSGCCSFCATCCGVLRLSESFFWMVRRVWLLTHLPGRSATFQEFFRFTSTFKVLNNSGNLLFGLHVLPYESARGANNVRSFGSPGCRGRAARFNEASILGILKWAIANWWRASIQTCQATQESTEASSNSPWMKASQLEADFRRTNSDSGRQMESSTVYAKCR
jgi:hypothetical protein